MNYRGKKSPKINKDLAEQGKEEIMKKIEYTELVKYPQIAGNPQPHLMGWWYVTLIYDSPEKDCQIGSRKVYKPLKEPKRVKSWSTSKIKFCRFN